MESYPEDRSSKFISTSIPNYTASSVIKPIVYKVRSKFYDTLGMGVRRICNLNYVPRPPDIANIINALKLVVLGIK
jgi:hypothetical protein